MDKQLRRSMVLVILFMGWIVTAGVEAATLTVGPSGYPYTSIQAAITAASPGDTVLVHDGTYYEKINFSGKAITVKSANGAASTTIDGSSSGSVVTFANGEGPGSVLDGFTITNGNANSGGGIYCQLSSPTITNCTITGNSAADGGGIYCNMSTPTITNCTITGNSASSNGGGIYCFFSSSPAITNCTISGNSAIQGGGIFCNDASPTITSCTITGNSAGYGGGIYCASSSPTITNCTINENDASSQGGGIYCAGSSPTITSCTITGNSAAYGGGIYCNNSSPTITNCTITGNSGDVEGGGIYCYFNSSPTITNCTITGNYSALPGGGIFCSPIPPKNSPTVKNSILWGNSTPEIVVNGSTVTVTYSNVDQDGYAGSNGNIRQNPLFVNPANGNFRLQPTSPCIDAGTSDGALQIDKEGNARFDASWVPNTGGGTYPYYDMGALEYIKKPGAWHTFYGSSYYDSGNAIATDGSGNVYITGETYATWNGPAGESPLHAYSGSYDIFVLKLDSSGSYQWHTFYGSGGGDVGYGIAIDGSGNVYVTGDSYLTWNGPAAQSPLHAHSANRDIFVLKLDGSGTYQWHTFYGSTNYGFDTYSTGIATNGSGNLYVAGKTYATWNGPVGQSPLHLYSGNLDIFVLKLDSSGSYQWHTFYGSGDSDSSTGIATDGSGNVYLPGYSWETWNGPAGQSPLHAYSGNGDIFVLKLDSSGSYQWHTFYGSSDHDYGAGIATDGGGNVYVMGDSFESWNGSSGESPLHNFSGGVNDMFVLKLNSSGSFQWHTFYGSNNYDFGAAISTDGRGNIYITGTSYDTWNGSSGQSPLHAYSGGDDIFVLKLDSSGSYQWHTFYGSSELNYHDSSRAIDTDGSGTVYVTGFSSASWNGPVGESPLHAYSGNYDIFVLKLSDTPSSCDFDGDRKTDIAFYRSSTGVWWVTPSSGTPAYGYGWGGPGFKPVPGDFDGDGKTDIAIYDITGGAWWIIPSSGAAAYGVGWGGSAFKPVHGDYDGDGKTDIAIYNTTGGAWWIIPSSGIPAYGVGWGGSGFKPVPGDYDGDGKTDIAIYDTTGGAWWIIPSSGTPAYGVGWGGSAFKPVPGDYDGDGKTDIAIYHTTNGGWWIIPSSGASAYGVGWGGSAFTPVPGDFDGDGKTDTAVYKSSNGGWWIIYSSDGSYYGMGWGGDVSDVPVTTNPD